MIRTHMFVAACVCSIALCGVADAGFTYTESLTGLTVTGSSDQNSGTSFGGNQSTGVLNPPSTQTLLTIGAY